MTEPKIPGGYILLSRTIIEDQIWAKPPLYLKVWIYLLACAQHAEYKGLKRGQVFTSIPDIIDACKWKVGARTERPTKDQIFQIIEWLRKPDEHPDGGDMNTPTIATTKATHGMVINLGNYCFYQDPKNYESNDEHDYEHDAKATRRQRQPDNINKNVKNDKNVKNKDPSSSSTETENFTKAHIRTFGFNCNPRQSEILSSYIDDGMDESVVIHAIDTAGKKGTGHSFGLIQKILNDYLTADVKTIEQAQSFDNEFERRKREREEKANGKNRGHPQQSDSKQYGNFW